MANSDLVTPARRDIYVGDIKENRPNSENVNNKLAGNINFILERLVIVEKFVVNGYFNNETSYDFGVGGISRVENQAVISSYNMAIRYTGVSSTNQFNVAVYNSSGAFVNNLFSTPIEISANAGLNVVIGKDGVDTNTPTNFQVNNAGHSINHGTLALGTTTVPISAGSILVPFIVNNGEKAFNLAFTMKLKEL